MKFKAFMINEEKHSYSSTQVNLPTELSDKIIKWGEDNIKDSWLFNKPDDPTFGREYEPHVTILYGLHANKADGVKELLKNTNAFNIKLGKISVFNNNDNFDVIKVEVKSPQLEKLNKLFSKLSHTNLYPKYIPHVTVAYIKKNKCAALVGNDHFIDDVWKCDAILFSNKERNKTQIKLKSKSS